MVNLAISEIQNYKCVFLPGTDPEPRFRQEYQAAYKTWYNVWNDTFSNELNIDLKPVTDNFTRQHEIIGLYFDNLCAGLIALRWVDFSLINFEHDSYFKRWLPQDIAKLIEFGPRAMLVSNMAVNPEFRRSKTGLNFRDILLDLSARRFELSSGDVIGCVTRRDRNVQRLFYAMGAIGIQQDIPHFKEDDRIDIVAIYRDNLKRHDDKAVLEMTHYLWERKEFCRRSPEELIFSRQVVDISSRFKKTA